MSDERLARLLALKSTAEKLADPSHSLGIRAREMLEQSTGLSMQGVDYALRHCLEASVPRSTLSGMVKQQKRINRVHVLLSSNVFVATFRAIALGLCQSSQVSVRASRREPVMAQLLHEGSGGAFDLVEELTPQAGDHYWAYGSDDTLEALRSSLPPGILLHSHGFGMGAVVLRESHGMIHHDLPRAIDALAQDTAVFDQRGCLSPRLVLIEGSRSFAESICDLLVESLITWEENMPRGKLNEDEKADILRHEGTMTFLGSSAPAGKGMVVLDPQEERIMLPPAGRYLHVTVTKDAFSHLYSLREHLTTVGIYNAPHLAGQLLEKIGPRRFVELGQMQRPIFDGPVDLRTSWLSVST